MIPVINAELAKQLITEYKQQNAADGGPALRTVDSQHLDGFFIDKETLLAILDVADCDGVHIMLAKDPKFIGSKENIFNMLMLGSVAGNTSGNNAANVYGPTPTCPVICPPPLH